MVTHGLWLRGQLDVLPNSLKLCLRRLMVEKMNIQLSGNSSGGHSCNQQANCRLPQHETSVALCCVTKLYILWPFIVPRTRCTCVMIMLFNQLLDMPHLSSGWIILAKEKCLLTGINTFVYNIWEKYAFCVYGTFLEYFFSAHETWDQHLYMLLWLFLWWFWSRGFFLGFGAVPWFWSGFGAVASGL